MWVGIFDFVSTSFLSLLKSVTGTILLVLWVTLHSIIKTYRRCECRKLICDFCMSETNFPLLFIPKICAIYLIAFDRRDLKEKRTFCVKACVLGLRGRMADSLDTGIRERSDNDFSKQSLH